MGLETRRIDLPSGGWWEFRLPLYERDRRAWLEMLRAADDDDHTLGARVLLAFTIGTSLEIDLSYEGMGGMLIEDAIAVQQAYNDEIQPRFLGRAMDSLLSVATSTTD